MRPAPIGLDEAARLQRLHETGLLDTPAEERFDRLTRLASQVLDTPIALVSLVDSDRQWFKSRVGLDAHETPRDISFCGHAIHSQAAFVVEDSRLDARFADNPLVCGAPYVRFYAAWPLRAPTGERVGTLCGIDSRPRRLTPEQLQALEDLGHLVERELFFADLAAAAESAARATDARSRFLVNTSHELRTPLHSVIAASELLVAAEDPATRQELTETVRAAGESLATLVDELLDLSRIESGSFTLREAPFALRDVFRDAHRIVVGRGVPEQLEVLLELDSLPDTQLLGDGARLRQVLVNLLQNAVKFTDEGEVRLHAAGRTTADDRVTVRVEIIDTGIGMSPQECERVFEAFEQAGPDTGRKYGGTGLGLPICRQLVDRMGGELQVESQPGRGSRFWFALELPQARRDAVTDPAPTDLAARRLGVLVLDDSPTARKVTEAQLRALGLSTRSVSDASRGLQVLNEQRHDLILLDLQMPDIDGLELLRTVRHGDGPNRETPVVMLSGSAFEQDQEACLEAGASAFLAKPARRSELGAAIERALGARRSPES